MSQIRPRVVCCSRSIDKGHMENLFPEQIFHILCLIFMSLGIHVYLSKTMCILYDPGVYSWLRSQIKVNCRICFWCITSTYFVVFSYDLAQVCTIAKCMSLIWARSLYPRSQLPLHHSLGFSNNSFCSNITCKWQT